MKETGMYTITLVRKQKVARDTYAFYFSKPKNFKFIPGQYTTVILPIVATDGLGSSRDFTIASSPQEQEILLVTKKSTSDFKKMLFTLKKGERIEITHPMGGFYPREEMTRYVFISGGIGITVFRSMLIAKENENRQATLLASFSSPAKSIFQKELKEIGKKQKNKKIIYHITETQGRITKSNIIHYVPDIHEHIFMITGSEQFVYAMQELLRSMNVAGEKIKIDIFTGY